MKRIVALALILATTAPATALTSPVEARYEWKCPKYTQQIKQTFPRKDWRRLDAIMWRESRCETRAVGWNYRPGMSARDCKDDGQFHNRRRCKAVRSWDVGLFQITSSWYTMTAHVCGKNTHTKILMRSKCNFRVAKMLYDHGGLIHWQGSSK
jgi:hypothetical protein